jgi:hypothetical protein
MMTIQSAKRPWQYNIFPLLTMLGMALILISFLIGLFVLTPTAQDYWGSHAKETRDAAETGSALTDDLVTLTATNRWKEPLTFLGVASFMVGIAVLFSAIPKILQNRGQVLAICYPYIVNQ